MGVYFDILFKKKRNAGLLFVLSFLGMCLLYNYQRELFVRAHGYHLWRQADGFCIVNNYYRMGMDFIHPRISQLISDDGLELAEFPIVYYISALGYQLFGFHECIPRLVSLFFVLAGLWFLFIMVADILEDNFYGVILSLLLFTSPVLIFYSITPMPDVAAMSLAMIGLYYFYRYWKLKRLYSLIASFILYTLAGAIKPTSIVSLITIGSAFCLIHISEWLRLGKAYQPDRKSIIHVSVFFIASMAVIIAWWVYVAYYRNLHHTSYFQTNANPIWEATTTEIFLTGKRFLWSWMNHYFNLPSVILVGSLTVYSFIAIPKKPRWVFISYSLFLLGSFIYLLLFFTNLFVHDYYIIVILPLFIGSLFLFMAAMKSQYPAVFGSAKVKAVVIVFFLCNVGYATFKTDKRTNDPGFAKDNHVQLLHIEPYLDSLGVHQSDKVIYWGDFAPNIGLYFMNRRGWGKWAMGGRLSSESIKKCILKGAKYLVIDHNQCMLDQSERDAVGTFKPKRIGDRDGIEIYALPSGL